MDDKQIVNRFLEENPDFAKNPGLRAMLPDLAREGARNGMTTEQTLDSIADSIRSVPEFSQRPISSQQHDLDEEIRRLEIEARSWGRQ